MRIRIACGLDSRSRAGFWKNDRASVCTVRTITYYNTEEKRGTTFRSSTDEIFETLTRNNKIG